MPLSRAVVGGRGGNGSETTGRRQARMLGPVARGRDPAGRDAALRQGRGARRPRRRSPPPSEQSEAASEVQAALDEVVAALGLTDALESASPAELAAALAPIRALFLQANDLLHGSGPRAGLELHRRGRAREPGPHVGGFARVLRDTVAPQLDGSRGAARRAEGASFLDVGVGVAGLAIAMAGQWPNLRVVGIDPWEPSLDACPRQRRPRRASTTGSSSGRARVEDLDDRHGVRPRLPAGPLSPSVGARRRRGAPAGDPPPWRLGRRRPVSRSRLASTRRSLVLRAARSGGSSPTPAEVVGLLGGPASSSAGEFPAELGISVRARRRSPSVVFAA